MLSLRTGPSTGERDERSTGLFFPVPTIRSAGILSSFGRDPFPLLLHFHIFGGRTRRRGEVHSLLGLNVPLLGERERRERSTSPSQCSSAPRPIHLTGWTRLSHIWSFFYEESEGWAEAPEASHLSLLETSSSEIEAKGIRGSSIRRALTSKCIHPVDRADLYMISSKDIRLTSSYSIILI